MADPLVATESLTSVSLTYALLSLIALESGGAVESDGWECTESRTCHWLEFVGTCVGRDFLADLHDRQ